MNKDAVAEMSQQYQIETAQQLVPEGYKQTEVGVIPEDWEVKSLGTLVDIRSGESPSKFTFQSAGIPYFKVEQLNNDSVYADETPYFIENVKFIPAGSVIFPKRGASILLNKIRVLKKNSFMDTNLMTLTCHEQLDEIYLYNQLTYKGLDSVADTTSIPQINNKHIIPYLIPFPTKEEQFVIANALSDTDALLSELEKLIAKKQAIKTATMQQLLTGRTRLPQFAHHPDGSKKGYKQSELGEIPEDWEVEALGENCHTYSGGTPSTSNSSFYGGNINWITSSDLNRSLIFEVRGRITELGLEKSAAKMIQPGTFLIALYGATAGVCAISKISAAINQAVLAVIPKKHSSKYLYYWFNKNKDEIIDTYTQGGQPNLSGNIIRSVKLPIPLADEQTAIATILSDMDEEIQALEQRLNKTRQIKQGMMQELLTGKTRLVASQSR